MPKTPVDECPAGPAMDAAVAEGLELKMTPVSFNVWTVDEPEFLKDTEYKFNILTHPLDMAMGTGGKNDDEAKETIEVLADWALRKLFTACAKVLWWTMRTIVKRAFERRTSCSA